MNDFYRSVKYLDAVKSQDDLSASDIKTLLPDLRSTPVFRYFFYDLSNADFLKFSAFRSFLSQTLSENDNVRPHFVTMYLGRTVSNNPVEVYEVIRCSKPSDPVICANLLDVVGQLEAGHAAKLVRFVTRRLVHKGTAEGEDLGKLLVKYVEYNHKDEAALLLEHLTKPIPHKAPRLVTKEFPSIGHNEAEGCLEPYELEQVLKVAQPKLFQAIPLDLVRIFEGNLSLALDIEGGNPGGKRKDDFSYIWRPAVEEHEQNYDFGKIKEVLVSLLRDALLNMMDQGLADNLYPILRRYLRARYTIFKRFALFVISMHVERFKEVIRPFLLNKKNLDDHRIRHELFGLLQNNFPRLDADIRESILAWIEAGPSTDWWIKWRTKEEGKAASTESIAQFVNRWMLERYWPIRDHIPEKSELISSLQKELGTPDKPDFPAWHEVSTGGPESPLTSAKLKNMTENQLVDILKRPPSPTQLDPVYRNEALVLEFERVVKDNPQRYVPFASKMAADGVLTEFIRGYFRAMRESWAPHKLQWTEELQLLASLVANDLPNPHRWSVVDRSRLRLDLARLIEGIVSDRSIALSDEHLVKFRSLIISMVGDPDPDEKSETDNYSMNKDWPFIALNHTSGEVLHTLIRYALCYARKHPQPSERLEPEVRASLGSVLATEKRPSVLSVLGTYMANLWYLDADWIKQRLDLLFPASDTLRAEAVWDAYLKFNNVHKTVYEHLKPQYAHAVRALRTKKPKAPRDNHRLAQHLAIIFWHGWDDVKRRGTLVTEFFKVAPLPVRVGFIQQLGLGLREMKEQDRLKPDDMVWKRLRALWEWRLRVHQPVTEAGRVEDDLGAFLDWLPHVPEAIVDIENLVSRTLRKRSQYSQTGAVTKYLAKQSNEHPLECARLTYDLFSVPWSRGTYYFALNEVKYILETALNSGGVARGVAAKVASKLGEYGWFEFKDIWDRAQESKKAPVTGNPV